MRHPGFAAAMGTVEVRALGSMETG